MLFGSGQSVGYNGTMTKKSYATVVVGGTFDHLHLGHEALLLKAFSIGTHVIIGLTTDAYVQKYKHGADIDEENISGAACPCVSFPSIQSFITRKTHLEEWFQTHGCSDRVTIVPIDDIFGVTVSDEEHIDAIIVSSETHANADVINQTRASMRLPPLAVIEIPLVPAVDAKPISATRIRQGEIDEEGNLVLPDHLRAELALPIGTLLTDGNTESLIRGDHANITVSVGDKTTKRLLSNGLIPTLIIIDMQVERQPYTWDKEDWDVLSAGNAIRHIESGPGYISAEAVQEIASWASSHTPMMCVINGEEDLLVLPVILYAPIGTIVYYGQPKVGIVRVIVTEKIREKIKQILHQFRI